MLPLTLSTTQEQLAEYQLSGLDGRIPYRARKGIRAIYVTGWADERGGRAAPRKGLDLLAMTYAEESEHTPSPWWAARIYQGGRGAYRIQRAAGGRS